MPGFCLLGQHTGKGYGAGHHHLHQLVKQAFGNSNSKCSDLTQYTNSDIKTIQIVITLIAYI